MKGKCSPRSGAGALTVPTRSFFRQIAVNVLIDLHDAGTALLADAGAINLRP